MKNIFILSSLLVLSLLVLTLPTQAQMGPQYGNIVVVSNPEADINIETRPSFITTDLKSHEVFGAIAVEDITIVNLNLIEIDVELTPSDNVWFEEQTFNMAPESEKVLKVYIYAAPGTATPLSEETIGVIFRKDEEYISKSITVQYTVEESADSLITPNVTGVDTFTGKSGNFALFLENPYPVEAQVLISNPDPSLVTLQPDTFALSSGELKEIKGVIDTEDPIQKDYNIKIIYQIGDKSIEIPATLSVNVEYKLPTIWILLIALVLVIALIFIFRKKKKPLKDPMDRILDEIS